MSARFLVVDDDDAIRRLVVRILRRRRYEADEACDGLEAIARLSQQSYDALFLDLMMPICSGFEVLAFLRDQQIGRKCVVVMTAAGARWINDLDMTIVDRVLHKPFELREVVQAADSCAASSAA